MLIYTGWYWILLLCATCYLLLLLRIDWYLLLFYYCSASFGLHKSIIRSRTISTSLFSVFFLTIWKKYKQNTEKSRKIFLVLRIIHSLFSKIILKYGDSCNIWDSSPYFLCFSSLIIQNIRRFLEQTKIFSVLRYYPLNKYIKYAPNDINITIPPLLVSFLSFPNNTLINKSTAVAIHTILSILKPDAYTTGVIIAVVPTTNKTLKILLPTILPTAISDLPLIPAVTEVMSSGRDVPNATIVKPIRRSLQPKERAIAVAALTVTSLPHIWNHGFYR